MTPAIRPALHAAVVTLALAASTPADAPRLDVHGDPLPPGALARLGTVRYRHPGTGIVGLGAVDNKTVVSVGEDRHVCVWDLATGKRVRAYPTGTHLPQAFALTADGKRLAVAGLRVQQEGSPSEFILRVVETATGKQVREFVRGEERVERGGLAFTPDGKLLASFNAGVVRIEEVDTGVELLRENIRGDSGPISFSPDGKLLAIATGRTAFVWEWQAGVPPREVAVPPRGAYSLAFTADSQLLVTGDDGPKGIRFWDAATRQLRRTIKEGFGGDIHRVALSGNGRYLASAGSRDNALVLWDLATNRDVARFQASAWRIPQPVFTPDSRHLVVHGDRALAAFAIPSGKPVLTADGHTATPAFVALLGDGTAVTTSDDGTARVWDAATGKQRLRLAVSAQWVRGAAVSPDGRRLAVSTLEKGHAVRLYDVATGTLVYQLAGHGRAGGTRALVFTPDGKHLLSHGEDGYLRRWDVGKGKAIDEVEIGPDGRKRSDEDDRRDRDFDRGRFLPDGSGLVLWTSRHLFVFDARTGRQTKKIAHEEGMVMGLAASPDGKHLLMSAWGRGRLVKLPGGGMRDTADARVVCLFEVATGKQVWRREVGKGTERIGGVAIARDGTRYAVGCRTTRIEIGELATGKLVKTIPDVPASAETLAFSPDGKRVIAGLADTTAVVYDLGRE